MKKIIALTLVIFSYVYAGVSLIIKVGRSLKI